MDSRGWTKTKAGKRVYTKKNPAPFGIKSIRRILTHVIISGQLTMDERRAMAYQLYPWEDKIAAENPEVWWKTVRSILEKVIPLPGYLVELANWLVDQEVAAVISVLRRRLSEVDNAAKRAESGQVSE